jgi:hypothetical protein
MARTPTTIRDHINEQDLEMESGRVARTERNRLPEPSAIARLAMRAMGVITSLVYLAFFIYFGAAFDNIVPVAFVAVSLIL